MSGSSRGRPSAVQAALDKAAKLAERQAVLNSAECTVLAAYSHMDLHHFPDLPWSIAQPAKSCTQLLHTWIHRS